MEVLEDDDRGPVALLQLDPTVGDLEGNAALLLEAAQRAADAGASLAVSSELALSGYPPRDLLLDPTFIDRCLEVAADLRPALTTLVGSPLPPVAKRTRPGNGVIRLAPGELPRALTRKQLLPTYDVFDEIRYFEPDRNPGILRIGRHLAFGITVCEDAWQHAGEVPHEYDTDPIQQLASWAHGRDLLVASVNLSASPFHLHRIAERAKVVRRAAATLGHPYLLANQIGGNDDLVFDGRSIAAWPDGRLVIAPAWRRGILLIDPESPSASEWIDLEPPTSAIARFGPPPAVLHVAAGEQPPEADRASDVLEALTLALRDYTAKARQPHVVLGLSGGIDSAVVAALAARALGPDHVLGLALPSRHSSQHSRDDARSLAEALGIEFRELPIDPLHAGVESLIHDELTAGHPVANENVQARLRGLLVMAHANARGAMALATGNKSELAQGYCTLYGDMAGGYAPIGDVYKQEVYALAQALNAEAQAHGLTPPIPQSTLTKPPSAELAPDQQDDQTLPPYGVLDAILKGHIEEGKSARRLIDEGFEAGQVHDTMRRLISSEHKRRQMPPAPRVSRRAFGQGWRQPIAAKR